MYSVTVVFDTEDKTVAQVAAEKIDLLCVNGVEVVYSMTDVVGVGR